MKLEIAKNIRYPVCCNGAMPKLTRLDTYVIRCYLSAGGFSAFPYNQYSIEE